MKCLFDESLFLSLNTLKFHVEKIGDNDSHAKTRQEICKQFVLTIIYGDCYNSF